MSVSELSLEIKYYVIIAFTPSEIQQQHKTKSGAPNENIVQNHLNRALLNVF